MNLRALAPTALASIPLLLALGGCSLEREPDPGPRTLPARRSPTTTARAEGLPELAVVDRVSLAPTWYDPTTRQVMRMHDGAITQVGDATFDPPAALRVLDDDTIVLHGRDGVLTVAPPSGARFAVPIGSTSSAFDGHDAGSVWFVVWRLGTGGAYELCRATPAGAACVTAVPNVGAYSPALGVGRDGSVYVTDRGSSLYRWDGARLTEIFRVARPAYADFVVGFRHGGGPGMLVVTYGGLYGVEGAAMRRLLPSHPLEVSGAPDDFVAVAYDSESVKVDPACQGGWFRSCARRTTWFQLVVTEVERGVSRELGHEDCDHDGDGGRGGCDATTRGLGLDGRRAVLLGAPFRTLAR